MRGLHVADPDLGVKPLLAKLREQQPDLGAGNKEVREALKAVKAESEATGATAATAAAAAAVAATAVAAAAAAAAAAALARLHVHVRRQLQRERDGGRRELCV